MGPNQSRMMFRSLTYLRHCVTFYTGHARMFEGTMGDVEWVSWGSW